MGDKAQYQGKSKDELMQEARDQGITVDGSATKDQLLAALEAKSGQGEQDEQQTPA